jgi:plasmid rolling circle replication initiator protein Rep
MIDKKWNIKKKYELKMHEVFRDISIESQGSERSYYGKKASLLKTCGTYLEFFKCPHDHQESTRLTFANFCKGRLCPLCQWRRSLKVYHQVLSIAHEVQKKYPGSLYVFISLTARNVSAPDLPAESSRYLRAIRRLFTYKEIKKSIKGTFRSLEVTYNPDADTYHPHFHIIGVVDKSYFTDTKIYISQHQLTDLWQKAFQIDYTPVVHIRKVRKKNRHQKTVLQEVKEMDNDLSSAAAEVAKYSVKFKEVLNTENRKDVVKCLDQSLRGRRLTGYTGVMKEAYERLKLQDVETSDLVDIDDGKNFDETCQCSICKSELIQVQYMFDFESKKYISFQKKERI